MNEILVRMILLFVPFLGLLFMYVLILGTLKAIDEKEQPEPGKLTVYLEKKCENTGHPITCDHPIEVK